MSSPRLNVWGPAYSLYGVIHQLTETSLGVALRKQGFTDTARSLISSYPLMRPIEPREILTSPPQIKEPAHFTMLG